MLLSMPINYHTCNYLSLSTVICTCTCRLVNKQYQQYMYVITIYWYGWSKQRCYFWLTFSLHTQPARSTAANIPNILRWVKLTSKHCNYQCRNHPVKPPQPSIHIQFISTTAFFLNEQRHEKICLQGFPPRPTQTGHVLQPQY